MRGSNLAGDVAKELDIKRPASFPYPNNARTPELGSKK